MRILLAEVKLYVLAARVAVVALLAGATGARGQGVAGETYRTLAERGVRPALIYDVEGFVDMAGGGGTGPTPAPIPASS